MKKTYIYILIIIVIIAGVVIGVNLKEGNNTKETSYESIEKDKQNENRLSNKTIINEVFNNSTDENIEDLNNVTENTEESPEKKEETLPKTDLEKALYIVAEEWGEDSSVYFSFDEQTEDGEYIICVRENETTNALMWYKVNVQNETCEEW